VEWTPRNPCVALQDFAGCRRAVDLKAGDGVSSSAFKSRYVYAIRVVHFHYTAALLRAYPAPTHVVSVIDEKALSYRWKI
jgi:hypothetical protein